MSEKKGSVAGEKKKSSVRGSQIAVAVVETVPLTPEEAALAQAAKEAQELLEMRALPVRQYLEASVVPLLLHGLQLLAIERPENPVDFLAKYLLEKNPK
ncbi:hypothetical protein KC19_8G149200 [Ceratodon purpureus]|uniref:Uncharacterized protein n=1 Tax=Ceratodon purpureus TaxID=3225 RepID=A0A8T0H2B0_CERPU|nr:hypothetical protein KC19_8G149200 [Ceratodon purpureus]KAG0564905.1 hypothetical protein KC19_8G149200 [Ceratodon purpureus]KAG0564907.1 hypothetical protein KC19_8G149200 [Ceratodon purpureus]